MGPNAQFPTDALDALCAKLGLRSPTPIGQGSFKQVFRANSQQGLVALKVCTAPGYSPRNQREVEILSKCDHPGISKMFAADTFTHQSHTYQFVVEELMDAGTLSDRYAAAGSMPKHAALQLMQETVETLSYLRGLGRGFVHRDIKPDNIMFRASGSRSVLVDFGIARSLGDVSLTHSWLAQGPGTPYFAAPEQLRNEKGQIDWRTDQFALGVTVSVCALGIHPYQIQGEPLLAGSTIDRVANRQGPSAAFKVLAAGTGLEILLRLVQPWPIHRYRFPEQLLTDIAGA